MYGEETVLLTGMGYFEDGYKVDDRCKGCPYWHEDIEGDLACWKEEFESCEYHGIKEINMDKLSIISLQAELLDSIENAYTKAIKSGPRTVDAINNLYKVLDETNDCRKALYEELELLKKEN